MDVDNKENPKISVIIPVYNSEKYLDEAVQSILDQTFSEFELIIINDGSTDSSLAMLKKWAEKDRRIRLFDQENAGRSFTRNRGLELAESEYIAMLDSDDIALPTRLEVHYEFMENNPEVVIVGAQIEGICMKGLSLFYSGTPLFDHNEIETALLNDHGVQLCQGASLMRKSAALKVGGYNEKYTVGEDTDLFLRMALIGKLANVSNVLLKYRQHIESATNASNSDIYRNSMLRIEKAWLDRGETSPPDFKHWSEGMQVRTPKDDLLQWGWNALAKRDKKITKYYAKRLLFMRSFDLDVLRFYFCILRDL
jgi:glycosyltransferase involved in cell wall biosynthesis